jgi:hypothetical protein
LRGRPFFVTFAAMKSLLPFLLLASLSACTDERPPAPTPEESARLDEAEAMLNEAAHNEATR